MQGRSGSYVCSSSARTPRRRWTGARAGSLRRGSRRRPRSRRNECMLVTGGTGGRSRVVAFLAGELGFAIAVYISRSAPSAGHGCHRAVPAARLVRCEMTEPEDLAALSRALDVQPALLWSCTAPVGLTEDGTPRAAGRRVARASRHGQVGARSRRSVPHDSAGSLHTCWSRLPPWRSSLAIARPTRRGLPSRRANTKVISVLGRLRPAGGGGSAGSLHTCWSRLPPWRSSLAIARPTRPVSPHGERHFCPWSAPSRRGRWFCGLAAHVLVSSSTLALLARDCSADAARSPLMETKTKVISVLGRLDGSVPPGALEGAGPSPQGPRWDGVPRRLRGSARGVRRQSCAG